MKWNQERRVSMYKSILEKYGPHEKWNNRLYPSDDKKKEFDTYMVEYSNNLSKLFEINFGKFGPRMQFEWAVTNQSSIKGVGHTSVFILNKAAAYEAGFITSKEFPPLMEVESSEIWSIPLDK